MSKKKTNSYDLSSLAPIATSVPSDIARELISKPPTYTRNGEKFECIVPQQIELTQHIVFVPDCAICNSTGYIDEALGLPCVCHSIRMKIDDRVCQTS